MSHAASRLTDAVLTGCLRRNQDASRRSDPCHARRPARDDDERPYSLSKLPYRTTDALIAVLGKRDDRLFGVPDKEISAFQ